MSRAKVFAAGIAFVAAYVVVAAVTFRSGILPVRPIYEGTAPQQPYRWVSPPEDLAGQNTPPQPVTKDLSLKDASSNTFATTPDGQAAFIPGPNTFARKAEQTAVRVTIQPLDPNPYGDEPGDLEYDGNAYSFAATFVPSGEEAPIAATSCDSGRCPTIALTYPYDATELDIYRRDGDAWTKLTSQRYGSQRQVTAMTERLGIFVVLHKAATAPRNYGPIVSFALGLFAILASTLLASRRARSRTRPASGRKAPPKASRKAKVRAVKRWLRS